jgi:hypothetical protein
MASVTQVCEAVKLIDAAVQTKQDGPSVTMTMEVVAALERRALQLQCQAELLADNVLNNVSPGLSEQLAGLTPGMLAGLEAAMRSLRSVATALALASDGPRAIQQQVG